MKRILLHLGFALIFVINVYGQSGQDENVSWNIVDSTLTLTGTGAMKDYDLNNNKAPWYPHRGLIKNVVIETGLTTIGQSAFAMCPILANIEITDSVTIIGDNAFLVCRNLVGINIPDSTKTIGALAFGACSALTGINLPKGVETIGEGAFSGCSKLNTINVDNNNSAFKDINGIVFSKDDEELLIYPAGKEDSLYIVPDHVTTIGYGAFLNCENLARIEVQDGVTTIGREAFYNCQKLKIVKIPGSVISIGNNTFHYCNSLDTIEVDWATPVSVNSGIFTASSIANATLSVPEGTKSAYEAANVWRDFGSIVERITTGNNPIFLGKVNASYTNGVLTINSPCAEIVKVYNIAGTLICTIEKAEGKLTYPFSNLPNGIYIATGNNGWSVKVLKK